MDIRHFFFCAPLLRSPSKSFATLWQAFCGLILKSHTLNPPYFNILICYGSINVKYANKCHIRENTTCHGQAQPQIHDLAFSHIFALDKITLDIRHFFFCAPLLRSPSKSFATLWQAFCGLILKSHTLNPPYFNILICYGSINVKYANKCHIRENTTCHGQAQPQIHDLAFSHIFQPQTHLLKKCHRIRFKQLN